MVGHQIFLAQKFILILAKTVIRQQIDFLGWVDVFNEFGQSVDIFVAVVITGDHRPPHHNPFTAADQLPEVVQNQPVGYPGLLLVFFGVYLFKRGLDTGQPGLRLFVTQP